MPSRKSGSSTVWIASVFQLNYKAKHESEKFKCNVPADAPQFIQHRVNAYNLSDVSIKATEIYHYVPT